jgi:2,3-bisphosphoglycerate-dependent phosphoglycerate mutase
LLFGIFPETLRYNRGHPVILQIVPQLVAGKHVMIAAHGNSLRSIIMHLDKLTSKEVNLYICFALVYCLSLTLLLILLVTHFFPQVISLELSTGIPMLYIFKCS